MHQHFAFFLIFSQKKKKGHNNTKHLLATLLATLDNLILYYTTKRDKITIFWKRFFLNIYHY